MSAAGLSEADYLRANQPHLEAALGEAVNAAIHARASGAADIGEFLAQHFADAAAACKERTSATPSADRLAASPSASEQWTVQGWLASLDLAEPVAAALSSAVPSGAAALEFLRSADCTRSHVDGALRAAGLSGLSTTVWAAVASLRTAVTATELQDKFLQGGAGLLSYSGLDTFFGGCACCARAHGGNLTGARGLLAVPPIAAVVSWSCCLLRCRSQPVPWLRVSCRRLEALVGPPHVSPLAAMKEEHTQREDSLAKLSTSNYGLTTASNIEWRFVAEPDAPPRGGWPIEERLRRAFQSECQQDDSEELSKLRTSGAQHRRPMPIHELKATLEAPNAKLEAMREPRVVLPEAIGARLYTGPLASAPGIIPNTGPAVADAEETHVVCARL